MFFNRKRAPSLEMQGFRWRNVLVDEPYIRSSHRESLRLKNRIKAYLITNWVGITIMILITVAYGFGIDFDFVFGKR